MLSEKHVFNQFRIFLFFLVALVYVLCARGLPWGESEAQIETAKNIVYKHSVVLTEFRQTIVKTPDGRMYDYHGFLNSLYLVVFLFLPLVIQKILGFYSFELTIFLASFSGAFVCAAIVVVYCTLLRNWGFSLSICLYSSLCLAFASMVFPYALTSYEGNLTAFLILLGMYLLFRYKQTKCKRELVFLAVVCSASINTREFAWFFVTSVVIYVLLICLKNKEMSSLWVFIVSFIPFFLVWAWYNWIRTGSLILTPNYAHWLEGKVALLAPDPSFPGLRNFFFSIGGSVFIYCPTLILSIWGLRQFIIQRRQEAFFALLISLLVIASMVCTRGWFSFWGWGPRYLLDVLALLMLPLPFVFQKKYWRIFIPIIVVSVLIQCSAVFTNWHARWWHFDIIGYEKMFHTLLGAQWFDALRNFSVNCWNMVLGSWYWIPQIQYDPSVSEATLYTAVTIGTWWNRLFFLGVPPVFIGVYLIVHVLLIMHVAKKIKSLIKIG